MNGEQGPRTLPADWRDLAAEGVHVTLQVERDEDGHVRAYQPQDDYLNVSDLPLNRYGGGSFCRFRVPGGVHRAGVYLIATSDELVYVGECCDFSQRFNAGYGQISPRNCYRGGQETNWRINQLFMRCVQRGVIVAVHFIESDRRKALESAAIRAYQPVWNRRCQGRGGDGRDGGDALHGWLLSFSNLGWRDRPGTLSATPPPG